MFGVNFRQDGEGMVPGGEASLVLFDETLQEAAGNVRVDGEIWGETDQPGMLKKDFPGEVVKGAHEQTLRVDVSGAQSTLYGTLQTPGGRIGQGDDDNPFALFPLHLPPKIMGQCSRFPGAVGCIEGDNRGGAGDDPLLFVAGKRHK
jgi:hypothetical protein